MSKLMLSINVSLDGFADHTVATVVDDELHDFFTGLFDDIDVALLGRKTYELMVAYWPNAREDPNATAGMLRFADRYNAVPKIVFSRSLERVEWNNARLVKRDLIEEVVALKRQPGRRISLGGISISQQLMRRGLIDEYWLVVHPVVVGNGRRLFDGAAHRFELELLEERTFASGVVAVHYATKRPSA